MISSYNQFQNEMARIQDQTLECTPEDSLRLRHLTLTVERAGQMDTLNILMTKEFKIGFMPLLPEVKSVHEDYGFFESFPAGVSYGWNVLGGYVSYRLYLPRQMGLASVLAYDSLPKYYFGLYEHTSDSSVGWWSCLIPLI